MKIANLVLGFSLLFFFGCTPPEGYVIKQKVFSNLEKIRDKKEKQVVDYFKEIRNIAVNIKNDSKILNYFHITRRHYASKSYSREVSLNSKLELDIAMYYVKKYSNFYDILFVDNNGFIFYSIKKESDYHTNLFTGRYSNTILAKQIKNQPEKEFVDYEYYLPSEETAAFFVVPIREKAEIVGRIILQCSINKVNAMLSEDKYIGRTCEVYLVNRNKLMLSDSRFIEDSTIMKQKVDTESVKRAMDIRTGSMIIKDYRGVIVFSSFKQFSCYGSSWIILAEIDEDEVISNHYKKHKEYYLDNIEEYLSSRSRKKYVAVKPEPKNKKRIRVDINEFAKAKSSELLETTGIKQCTSIVVYYPKKFGYLVHVTPVDDIYIRDRITRFFLGNKRTSFLTKLIKRIKYYDIYPYELRNLRVLVIAPHDESIGSIIDGLLDIDVDISQIKFIFNPQADYVNVIFNQENDTTVVEWVVKSDLPVSTYEYASDVEDIGSIVKRIAKYSN